MLQNISIFEQMMTDREGVPLR